MEQNLSLLFGLSRGCRTCCRKQQNKIQPASRKSKREFSRRENTKCIFSNRRHLCFRLSRPAVQSLTFPGRQHIPFRHQPAKISRLHSAAAAANPSIAKCFFCSFGFPDAKTRGAYFFSIQSHRFRLGRPISPAANPITTSNKTTHSLPAPAGQHLQPPFFSYRPSQSLTSQLPSSRLGRPTPYIPPHHFSKIHQSLSSPTSSRLSPFRTSNSNLIPPLSQRPPLLPSCCRFSKQQPKRET